MKTSLNLEDEVFDAAKKEAQLSGLSISAVISKWARAGREALKRQPKKGVEFRPVDLGGAARVDLTHRRDWLDEIAS